MLQPAREISPAPAALPTAPPAGFWDRLGEPRTTAFVLLMGLLLYLPMAGSYGLWDPWETHYSEVARQMTKRSDFISLWWPCSPRETAVFQTKPVLTFWLISLGMHLFRIGLPGGPPGEMALGTAAEWAARVPFCLLAVLGIYGVYLVTARLAGRRAGVLAALVTATCPIYALVARQAMTDMTFVGPSTLALALAVLALLDSDGRQLPRRGRGWLSWPHHPLFYAALGLFLLATVPQLLIDSIDLRVRMPWGNRLVTMYGAVVMIPYWVLTAAVVALLARARYRRPLYLYPAAVLCGLAVLGKGLAGLGLPVIIFVAYLLFTGGWRRLAGRQLPLALVASVLVVVVVAVPWHHAMYIRHGSPWWNELFGDNHWNRMMVGRHGDTGAFDYFLRELGYGAWPWVALAPAALAWAASARDRRRPVLWLGAVWLVLAYAVVSSSMTKFHHYILPAIPGLGIVLGCFLDRLLDDLPPSAPGAAPADRARRPWLAAPAVLLGLPLLGLVTADLLATRNAAQRFLWLFSYDYVHSKTGRAWPDGLDFRPWIVAVAVLLALATTALAFRRTARAGLLGLAGAALLSTYFVLDVLMPGVTPFWSQKGVIATYYRTRSSPAERLVAFQMFWRGESFYTKNEIYEGPDEDRTVFDSDDVEANIKNLRAWIARNRGRRHFFLLPNGRESELRGALPPESLATFRIIDRRNNKFVLAEASL
jgi:4-amino-4-deoxy-L-arabinose transferase-like glycosyltransferase